MRLTYDIFSETNPAYVSCVIYHFVESFSDVRLKPPELHYAYIAVPILLSGDFSYSFNKTNKKTGLLEWLSRNPSLKLSLNKRINGSMAIVRDGIRLGCFTGILSISPDGYISLGKKKLKNINRSLDDESLKSVTVNAGRLGHWFASAGSSRAVLNSLELYL